MSKPTGGPQTPPPVHLSEKIHLCLHCYTLTHVETGPHTIVDELDENQARLQFVDDQARLQFENCGPLKKNKKKFS